MSTSTLVKFSNKYGTLPGFVLAGGGNTSYKNKTNLYVKGSGTSLATITEAGFVKMNRAALAAIWEKTYSADTAEREAQVLSDMMAAKCPGEEAKRPSVETLLHDLFPQKYVLHVHPTKVNAITCSVNGEATVAEMFPEAVWVDECEPGYILAANCKKNLADYKAKSGKDASVLFLQNHGIFFAADSQKELASI
ncbi:MAG: class II aldolase, partial [Clostridia bacterium]|nr:class II aldolase [Clostridia bacterium]